MRSFTSITSEGSAGSVELIVEEIVESMQMATKIVQVPMEDELRQQLDSLAEQQKKPRAEVIREACRRYLHRLQEEAWDRQDEEGYRRMPEDVRELDGFLQGYAQVLPEEDWEQEYQDWLAAHGER